MGREHEIQQHHFLNRSLKMHVPVHACSANVKICSSVQFNSLLGLIYVNQTLYYLIVLAHFSVKLRIAMTHFDKNLSGIVLLNCIQKSILVSYNSLLN